jgi:nucleoid-associated protein YgaU
MKTGIAGRLVLPLVGMILVMPGCTSIQDHWTISDNQPPIAGIPVEKALSSGPVDQDFAREARLEVEETDRVEGEAQEETRGPEEVLPEAEEAERVEAGAREEIGGPEEVLPEAKEAERVGAAARENTRRQEDGKQLLEELETSRKQSVAKEAALQEAERLRFSEGYVDAGFKPRYYVVRAGDTFNSIAANSLVYSNRNEWYTLYQANRDKLGNPDNPDLLAPGTVIEIPSIVGEIREGTY